MLAQSPGLGLECDRVSIGLRRFEHGKHVVFYRTLTDGIGIVRVLHKQMIPSKARFEA
jgi:toxin ParE1/3/4